MRLLVTRPAPRSEAVHGVLLAALRHSILGAWGPQLVRDALAEQDAVGRIRRRMSRFRLASCCSETLSAACALVGEDGVRVAARLRGILAQTLDDVIASAPPEHIPERVVALVEHDWPQFLEVYADEVIHGAHGGKAS
jgi:hypothetical protein